MKLGRQWLAFDAHFFGNTFTLGLLERFGPAGVTLFVAFLCACKRSATPGRIQYMSDAGCLEVLQLPPMDLVDAQGEPFTLDQFWDYCGRMKQTRRGRRGQVRYVVCTHWERWQNSPKTLQARERKRRSRAQMSHPRHALENESDKDTPYSPPEGDGGNSRNGKTDHTNDEPIMAKDAAMQAIAHLRPPA